MPRGFKGRLETWIKDEFLMNSYIILLLDEFSIMYIYLHQQNYYNVSHMYRKTESILPPLREKVDNYSYANKETIGKGFSSSVYRGRNDTTDEQVAIKVIDMKSMKGEVHRNLLAAQIQILGLMKNKPNILDVHKIYSDKNKTYIITDFCQGGDLGKVIKNKKKLSQSESVTIIQQIIKGYESLYSLGVVHRDLKPANIFFHNSLTEIGDFGFAIKQQRLKGSEKYNVGSPVYMPPQALSSNKYSHKSDIWAIGVIFYEMLTGNTPWSGRTEAELKTKMKTVSIKNILPHGISKASSFFLLKSLEVDQKKRMDIPELFSHFEGGYHKYDDDDSVQKNTKLFRSMKKPKRNPEFEKTRGDSLKKTSNNLGNTKNFKAQFLQTQIPKTAMESKSVEKEYVSAIQKRIISKQLLSQVHFCRFIYKLIVGLHSKLSHELSVPFKKLLVDLLFSKLNQIRDLKLVSRECVDEYLIFGDYKKLLKLVQQYQGKYKRKLNLSDEDIICKGFESQDYQCLLQILTQQILGLYEYVDEHQEPFNLLKQIVVLDYMITLKQLLQLVKRKDLQQFYNKSKIQAIVEGDVISQVSGQHVRMISNKLRSLRII